MKAQLAMNRENTARTHTGSARICSVPTTRAKSERMKGSERALQSFSAAARKINRPGDERFIFLVFAFTEQSSWGMRGHDDASTYSVRVLPINLVLIVPVVVAVTVAVVVAKAFALVSGARTTRTEITRRRRDAPGTCRGYRPLIRVVPLAMWLFSWRFDSNRTHC